MGFFEEQESADGLTVRLHLSRRDLKAALKGTLALAHPDQESEDAGSVVQVIVNVAPV